MSRSHPPAIMMHLLQAESGGEQLNRLLRVILIKDTGLYGKWLLKRDCMVQIPRWNYPNNFGDVGRYGAL